MERESFEDSEVAGLLNEHFISVKIDREERPDLDHIYMAACMVTNESGGWPLSVFIDSEKKPFFAGTYYPKHTRGQFMGFIELLGRISDLWNDNREVLKNSAEKIVEAITETAKTDKAKRISSNIAETAFKQFERNFDRQYGGFGNAPKFPSPHQLIFLLRYAKVGKESKATEMVEKTLLSMYKGGIYDHIGYGFSRYSTDRMWLEPHFEKMLYDNALLIIAYTECYKVTRNPLYSKLAKQIADYILRDMTSPEGGFYSAEDADSEGEEGKFYIWSTEEITDILGKDSGKQFCQIYDITHNGNFHGRSIPNLIKTDHTLADTEFCSSCLKKLYTVREQRIHPFKDDKILTSLNGLMIAALAVCGRALSSLEMLTAAQKAADFVLCKLYTDGSLKSRYRQGDVRYTAYAEDYSFLIWGLIELYEATFTPHYLTKALELTDLFISECWDEQNGGFFLNSKCGEQLITRSKEIYDGATPSANSVAAYNLIRLSRLTGIFGYNDKAQHILNCFSGQIERMPMGHSFSALALLSMTNNPKEITITAQNIENAQPALDLINSLYLPNATVIFYDGKNGLEETISMLKDYKIPKTGFLAYVCENRSCHPPTDNNDDLLYQLQD
ncbi:spermatogenesis-associated protein 20 [Holotrichia oblita]|nr:spermatogenesis-associated protein 20 [Holotrichia oblita]